jgi:hypothetical protein
MMYSRFIIPFLLIGLLAACSALDASAATFESSSATEAPPPSPTIVWFPPSVTPSPQIFITQTATPEMRPGLANILLTDDFSSPANWDTAVSDEGSASVERNQLTLAVKSGVYVISLRHDLVVNDFYAEITARPLLCRGEDSYGLLVRANAVAYYRFALSCNGTVHVERMSAGKKRVLAAPIPSGDAPPGAPGEARIGIWAVGNEMRLFLNGRYQLSVTDSNYPAGTVGVFASSAGRSAVTVSFTDLRIQEVTYIPPTGTPSP